MIMQVLLAQWVMDATFRYLIGKCRTILGNVDRWYIAVCAKLPDHLVNGWRIYFPAHLRKKRDTPLSWRHQPGSHVGHKEGVFNHFARVTLYTDEIKIEGQFFFIIGMHVLFDTAQSFQIRSGISQTQDWLDK